MEESTLYNLLGSGLLHDWENQAEKNNGCVFIQKEKEIREELIIELNEKNKNLLNSYALAVENRIDYLYYNLNIKILNLGIKIGMDLQKAFTEYE